MNEPPLLNLICIDDLTKEVFNTHDLPSTNDDLDELYFHFMNCEHNDGYVLKQSVTVSFKKLKLLLKCLQKNKLPKDIKKVKINL